jgi:hypothetical protein
MTKVEQKVLTDNAIEVIDKLFEKYVFNDKVSNENKEGWKLFLEKYAQRYFMCPASGKLDQHSPYPGGLAVHSLKVYERLIGIRDALGVKKQISVYSALITSLFHDVGKIGSEDGTTYYIPEESDWHRNKLGRMFTFNNELQDGLTVPLRSLRLIEGCGIKLTNDEFHAILYHDGLYVESNRIPSVMFSKIALTRILQMADSFTALVDDI